MTTRPLALAGPEDWRILSALALYRLVLVILLILLYQTGAGSYIFDEFHAERFRAVSVGYALLSLLLLLLVLYRWPRLTTQSGVHFAGDLAAVLLLADATGGIAGGLGVLLLTPSVAASLVLRPRLALLLAAVATLAMFGAEGWRHLISTHGRGEYTQTAALGLILFALNLTASTVAQRARRSEAMAERVGSAYVSLARLNESVIESMQTGVVVVDPEGRVRSVNAAARRLLGRPVLTDRALDTQLPRLHERLQRWRQGSASPLQPFAETAHGLELIPRFSRLGWGEDAPVLVLLDNASQLREQAQQLKLAALGRLAASIAHEIRNPLAAISHAGQLLSESSVISGEDQRLLAMIQRHSERIDKIVRDVLDLTRRASPRQEELPLRPWLQRTIALYREGRSRRAPALELLEIAPSLSVRFDPGHLQQVLFNLWDNSANQGEQLRVILSADRLENGRTYLEIADNGPGIAPEIADKIFEPFFTTDAAGTGLGLYLARELCEYNQAQLQHLPQRRGACFRILFPWEPEALPSPKPARA